MEWLMGDSLTGFTLNANSAGPALLVKRQNLQSTSGRLEATKECVFSKSCLRTLYAGR